MLRASFSLALLLQAAVLVCAPAGAQRKKRGADANRPPDVEVVEIRIQREEKAITVDGKVRNKSGKPIRGLVVFFELLEGDGKMISRMHTEVSGEPIEPGAESEFTAQTPDQVRAVQVRLDAEDKQGHYLVVDKPGPHAIE